LSRLTEMGVEPFLTASAVDCVIAQRLVRKLCEYCREAYPTTKEMLERLGFACEGTVRRAGFRHGQWHDMCIYGMLRQEWGGTIA